MTDHTTTSNGDADEPTVRHPAAPPHPTPTAADAAATEPPRAERPTVEQPAGPPAPPPHQPSPYQPSPYQPAGVPPHRWWRDRRVSPLIVIAALLVGCLCGAGMVASVAIIAGIADHHDNVRVFERHGPGEGRQFGPGEGRQFGPGEGRQFGPGQGWRDDQMPRNRQMPPGQLPNEPVPATPSTPAPTASS